jgi:hypothetical protein
VKNEVFATFNSPFSTKKGLLSEKSFAFTLWVVKLAKYLQAEKEVTLTQ